MKTSPNENPSDAQYLPVLEGISQTLRRIEKHLLSRKESWERTLLRREGEDKCLDLWRQYMRRTPDKSLSGHKRAFADLLKLPKAARTLERYGIATPRQIARSIRNAQARKEKAGE